MEIVSIFLRLNNVIMSVGFYFSECAVKKRHYDTMVDGFGLFSVGDLHTFVKMKSAIQ